MEIKVENKTCRVMAAALSDTGGNKSVDRNTLYGLAPFEFAARGKCPISCICHHGFSCHIDGVAIWAYRAEQSFSLDKILGLAMTQSGLRFPLER